MDIPKNTNLNKLIYFALACLSILFETKALADILAKDKKPVNIVIEETSGTIASLEKKLAGCKKSNRYFEIKYHLGIAYFKAQMMNKAKTEFLQISKDPNCPEIIYLFGLNMAGQTSRLMGQKNEALDFFERLSNIIEQPTNNFISKNPVLFKLGCLALIARAEIYNFDKNFNSSIDEYNRLMNLLEKRKDILSDYKPLIIDRISQLFFKQRDFEKYLNSTKTLITSYPKYYRTPVIKLEIESTILLKNINLGFDFSKECFEFPTQAILYFKNSKNQTQATPFINKLNLLSKEYQNTYGGTLILYHYAWLLDAFDEKDRAAEAFRGVFSTKLSYKDKFEEKSTIEIIQNYAKIQYATLLSEKGNYKEAMNIVMNIETQNQTSHLKDIYDSTRQSIQIFMKEVIENESD